VLQHDEGGDDLAPQLVGPADGAAFGHGRMREEGALHFDGAEPVRGNLDDLVGASREPEVAVLVHVRRVARVVGGHAGDALPVVAGVAIGVFPERRRETGKRAADHHDALLVRSARVAVRSHHRRVDARQRHAGRAGLDRQQAQAVRVSEDGASRLRLPHVIDDRHTVVEHGLLQPGQRLWVQHLARADNALEPAVIDPGQDVGAVPHQHADRRGRREDAGDAELLDGRAPVRVGVRMVERAFEGDRRAAGQQRRIDHVAVADDPADVGGGPPDVGRLQAEAPAAHARDVHLIAAVRVDGQLGRGGGPRRREDECRGVRLHYGVTPSCSAPPLRNCDHESRAGDVEASPAGNGLEVERSSTTR
jgi:hypothetical protein